MSLFVNGKLLSVITYNSDKPLTDYPEFLEACTKYEIIHFADNEFEYPIDCLPANIKYIDLGNTRFNLPLNNLPNQLVGISLPENYTQPLDYLPYGIKYIEIRTCKSNYANNELDKFIKEFLKTNPNLPSTIELIITVNGKFTKEGKPISSYRPYSNDDDYLWYLSYA